MKSCLICLLPGYLQTQLTVYQFSLGCSVSDIIPKCLPLVLPGRLSCYLGLHIPPWDCIFFISVQTQSFVTLLPVALWAQVLLPLWSALFILSQWGPYFSHLCTWGLLLFFFLTIYSKLQVSCFCQRQVGTPWTALRVFIPVIKVCYISINDVEEMLAGFLLGSGLF